MLDYLYGLKFDSEGKYLVKESDEKYIQKLNISIVEMALSKLKKQYYWRLHNIKIDKTMDDKTIRLYLSIGSNSFKFKIQYLGDSFYFLDIIPTYGSDFRKLIFDQFYSLEKFIDNFIILNLNNKK